MATQKRTVSKIDALQLEKNIEELMKRAQLAQEAQLPMLIDSSVNSDSGIKKEVIEKPDFLNPSNTTKTTNTKPNPTLKKATVKSKSIDKKKTGKTITKAKAVMTKKIN